MFLVVGLGNPGNEYKKTRHNVGFMVIDKLADKLNIDLSKKKFDAEFGEGRFGTEKIILAKPQTYMNLSGVSVSQILDFYKIDTDDLIVIYDDIDIEPGKIRVKPNGSAGTHNGMRNIVQMLATEAFPRIRVGTGKPAGNIDLASYVLGNFNDEEIDVINKAVGNAAEAVCKIVESDVKTAMNEFNGL